MLTFFIYAITTVFVIASVLMILVVLMQRPRSEGLGSAFGGGMTESLFGAGTTDVLTKVTIWLASIFFVCTLTLAILYSTRSRSEFDAAALLQEPAAQQEIIVEEEVLIEDPSVEPDSTGTDSPAPTDP